MEFKEGCCYKHNWGFDKIWYFRFEKIEDNGDLYSYGYFISLHQGLYLTTSGALLNIDYDPKDKDSFEEIDFSLIVPYLPEEHPDKVIYNRKQRINKLLCM